MDGSKVVSTPGGEGLLANFFNSLLHKKSGASPSGSTLQSPGSAGKTPETDKGSSIRSDAAAELDRLAKKTPTSGGSVDFNASDC